MGGVGRKGDRGERGVAVCGPIGSRACRDEEEEGGCRVVSKPNTGSRMTILSIAYLECLSSGAPCALVLLYLLLLFLSA